MKHRYRIPRGIVEKYVKIIYFMVEIDYTRMKIVEPRKIFFPCMGYEVRREKLDWYAKIMLDSPRDASCERWGTYQEKFSTVREQLYSGTRKKKVEKMEPYSIFDNVVQLRLPNLWLKTYTHVKKENFGVV